MTTALASRPWRNNNPGDLRLLSAPQKWAGQSGVDVGPGGPFAIFPTRAYGWRALATCLIAYQELHNLHTVRDIVGRYAPALENDTGGYISLVCKEIGRGPDDTINVRLPSVMVALVKAIALAEGGARLPWPPAEIVEGLAMAGLQGAAA